MVNCKSMLSIVWNLWWRCIRRISWMMFVIWMTLILMDLKIWDTFWGTLWWHTWWYPSWESSKPGGIYQKAPFTQFSPSLKLLRIRVLSKLYACCWWEKVCRKPFCRDSKKQRFNIRRFIERSFGRISIIGITLTMKSLRFVQRSLMTLLILRLIMKLSVWRILRILIRRRNSSSKLKDYHGFLVLTYLAMRSLNSLVRYARKKSTISWWNLMRTLFENEWWNCLMIRTMKLWWHHRTFFCSWCGQNLFPM